MYSLIARMSPKELLIRQAPTLLAALGIAEMFYKWHSFLLEAGGFLATWFVLDAAVHAVEAAVRGRGQGRARRAPD